MSEITLKLTLQEVDHIIKCLAGVQIPGQVSDFHTEVKNKINNKEYQEAAKKFNEEQLAKLKEQQKEQKEQQSKPKEDA